MLTLIVGFTHAKKTCPPSDSFAAAATFGSAIIHDEGGLPGIPQFDRFLEEWSGIGDDAEGLEYINSKQVRE